MTAIVAELDRHYLAQYGITYQDLRERVAAVSRGEFIEHPIALQRLAELAALAVRPASPAPGETAHAQENI